jgi:archaellum component FlaG (FlaF/FlaG flagellin family)
MTSVIGELVISASIVVMFIAFIMLCAWMYPTMTEVKKMDCSMVEFSPDVAIEIKQLCREARSKK